MSNPVNPSIIPENTSAIPENMFGNASKLNPLLRAVKKSPIPAVIESIKSNTPFTEPEFNRLPTAFAAATTIFLKKSTIENKPLKVLLSLSEFSSLNIRFEVRFLKPTLKAYKCLAVVAGIISLNASFTGVTTLSTALNMFANPSITAERPPKSFHP